MKNTERPMLRLRYAELTTIFSCPQGPAWSCALARPEHQRDASRIGEVTDR